MNLLRIFLILFPPNFQPLEQTSYEQGKAGTVVAYSQVLKLQALGHRFSRKGDAAVPMCFTLKYADGSPAGKTLVFVSQAGIGIGLNSGNQPAASSPRPELCQ